MTVILSSGYTVPGGDLPLTHARIAHSGNWLTGGTVTASSTAAGFFAEGPTNTLTYEKWKPGATSSTWEYDHGSTTEIDYCVIGAHTLGTSGSQIGVQTFALGVWANYIPFTSITDDSDRFIIFPPDTDDRFRITVTETPEIGVIKFGKALQMERPIFGGHSPFSLARQTTMRANVSSTGEFLGFTKQRTMLQSSFEWSGLTDTWVRSNVPALQRAMEADPIFVAWRPADYGEVVYGWAQETPQASNSGGANLMSMSMSLMGYSHD